MHDQNQYTIMASMKSLAKDTAIYGLSSIVGRFLNYLLVPLYTHVIAASSGGYGVVTNMYAYVALLLVILTFGMETTFFRFANKEGENPHSVFSTSIAIVSTLSAVFLAAVFTFTANQEKEHAEIFYQHMQAANGQKVRIAADYPVDVTNDACELLRRAKQNEFDEFDTVYPDFARIARQEGFPEIAASFEMISKIEQAHGNRFGKYLELLEQGKLFVNDIQCGWLCLNCGHIHTGLQAPERCPVCNHEQGFFIRLEMSPYGGPGILTA